MMDPKKVIPTIGRLMLTDGLPFVYDIEKSKGSRFIDLLKVYGRERLCCNL